MKGAMGEDKRPGRELPTFGRILSDLLREMRAAKNQRAFGKEVGLPQSVVSVLETGDRVVRSAHVDKVLEATNTSLVDFCRALLNRAQQAVRDSESGSPRVRYAHSAKSAGQLKGRRRKLHPAGT